MYINKRILVGFNGVVLIVCGDILWYTMHSWFSEHIILFGILILIWAMLGMKNGNEEDGGSSEVLYEHIKKVERQTPKPYNPDSRSWGCEE